MTWRRQALTAKSLFMARDGKRRSCGVRRCCVATLLAGISAAGAARDARNRRGVARRHQAWRKGLSAAAGGVKTTHPLIKDAYGAAFAACGLPATSRVTARCASALTPVFAHANRAASAEEGHQRWAFVKRRRAAENRALLKER